MQDLYPGKIYRISSGESDWVFRYKEGIKDDWVRVKSMSIAGGAGKEFLKDSMVYVSDRNLREATENEIGWLKLCERNGEFMDRPLEISQLHPGKVYHLDIERSETNFTNLVFRFKSVSMMQNGVIDPDRVVGSYCNESVGTFKKGEADDTPFVTGRNLRAATAEEEKWLLACELSGKYVKPGKASNDVLIELKSSLKREPFVLVCKKVEDNSEKIAGCGYEEGFMGEPIDRNNLPYDSLDLAKMQDIAIFQFKHKHGVFGRALRYATKEEIEFYKRGGRNIKDMQAELEDAYSAMAGTANSKVKLHYSDSEGNSKVSEGISLDDAMKNAVNYQETDFVINE